jgi:hypothetical protein
MGNDTPKNRDNRRRAAEAARGAAVMADVTRPKPCNMTVKLEVKSVVLRSRTMNRTELRKTPDMPILVA